ncbi:hypothetical protein HPB50_016128 [Hyalomma asiaticum]|uniref:Uncharacterized protein n=1 Tax=Hyalomma asiaticum TaxID=266040 RepID=A0ACB7RSC3_HYAAI|nr:hypothetical protein HPB50_016128 [Hyalomma asiaticum]
MLYKGLEEPRLVYPRLLEGRSSDGKLVLHVHDELTLNLEQATVAAPQLRFIEEKDGVSVTEMFDGNEINSNLYQDRDRLATVEVKLREGSAEIRGIVGPDHRIQPVLTAERSESGLIPHMVHEIQHAKVHDKAISFLEKGIAYVSGICTRFYVGLGEDAPGVFTGVHTVTHEIGHLCVFEVAVCQAPYPERIKLAEEDRH